MWTLDWIEIQGFKSFKNKEKVEFFSIPNNAFVFVAGKNLIEPELEGNGAGKSAIFDAIEYLLFGKTYNVKATDLKSWTNEKCIVKGQIHNDQDEYIITRTKDPNTLTVNKNGGASEAKEQGQLEEFLGYDLRSFEYSVVMSQFSRKFFDLSPSEKMQLFDSVMEQQLKIWGKASDKAKEQAETLEKELQKIKEEKIGIQGQLVQLEKTDFKSLLLQWEQEKQDELAMNKERQEKLLQQINLLKDKAVKVKAALIELEKKQEENIRLLTRLERKKEKKEAICMELSTSLRVFNHEKGILQKQKERLLGLGDKSVCPVCGSIVNKEHLKTELTSLADQEKNLNDKVTEIQTKLNQENKEDPRLVALSVEYSSAGKEQDTLVKQQQQILWEIQSTQRQIQERKEEQKKIEQKNNPYEEQAQKVEKNRIRLQRKLHHLEESINKTEEHCSSFRYWIKGFKEVRLMVVGKAISDLELYINDYLQRLGLSSQGWSARLEMDRETQNKTLSKGFSVKIQSPDNDKLVPFECWSGGEGQRLRLAGSLGFMDFVHSKKGGQGWSFEVWDEPTQWLSEAGIQDLLEVLEERAKRENRQIFLIDHRDFGSLGNFDSTLTVIKNEHGSRIQK